MNRSRTHWLLIVFVVAAVVLLCFLMQKKTIPLPALLVPSQPSCNGHPGECAVALDTLNALPKSCRKYVRSLTIRYDASNQGGFADAYGNVWVMGNVQPGVLRALLIHECGHVVDFFSLSGAPRGTSTVFTVRTIPTFLDDESLQFYTLSWTDPSTKKPLSRDADFVSAYAQAGAIEDFADTYAYYVLQRQAFEQRMRRSTVLRQKYAFMQRLFPPGFSVAQGSPWNGATPAQTAVVGYVWNADMHGAGVGER